MSKLQLWMRVVGVLYLFIAGASLPFGAGPGEPLPGFPFDQQFAQRMEDYQFLGGLMYGVLGAALLYGSRAPEQNLILVWTVVIMEIVRGLLGHAYLLGRGAPSWSYGPLLLLHLVIMLAGIEFARRARTER